MGRRSMHEDEAESTEIPGLPEGIECHECGDPVDLIAVMHQFVGPNQFICVTCKESRFRERGNEKAEELHKAVEIRAKMRQLSMTLTK